MSGSRLYELMARGKTNDDGLAKTKKLMFRFESDEHAIKAAPAAFDVVAGMKVNGDKFRIVCKDRVGGVAHDRVVHDAM